MTVLVTGGAGYIGSHTCLKLIEAGHNVVIADNFSNSNPAVIDRLRGLTKEQFAFKFCDLSDKEATESLFNDYEFNAVIHFAGYKAVGESVKAPLKYYEYNISSNINLLNYMEKHHVDRLIFS